MVSGARPAFDPKRTLPLDALIGIYGMSVAAGGLLCLMFACSTIAPLASVRHWPHAARQGVSRGIQRGTLARKSSYWAPKLSASTGSS
jgi:hypothetical protein